MIKYAVCVTDDTFCCYGDMMTDKQVRKLKRAELIEILYYLRKENDELREENDKLNQRIDALFGDAIEKRHQNSEENDRLVDEQTDKDERTEN